MTVKDYIYTTLWDNDTPKHLVHVGNSEFIPYLNTVEQRNKVLDSEESSLTIQEISFDTIDGKTQVLLDY